MYDLPSFDCACRMMIEDISAIGPASALPVMRLSSTYGIWNRPCYHQLAQLDCNLSNVIDAAIDSLGVVV